MRQGQGDTGSQGQGETDQAVCSVHSELTKAKDYAKLLSAESPEDMDPVHQAAAALVGPAIAKAKLPPIRTLRDLQAALDWAPSMPAAAGLSPSSTRSALRERSNVRFPSSDPGGGARAPAIQIVSTRERQCPEDIGNRCGHRRGGHGQPREPGQPLPERAGRFIGLRGRNGLNDDSRTPYRPCRGIPSRPRPCSRGWPAGSAPCRPTSAPGHCPARPPDGNRGRRGRHRA